MNLNDICYVTFEKSPKNIRFRYKVIKSSTITCFGSFIETMTVLKFRIKKVINSFFPGWNDDSFLFSAILKRNLVKNTCTSSMKEHLKCSFISYKTENVLGQSTHDLWYVNMNTLNIQRHKIILGVSSFFENIPIILMTWLVNFYNCQTYRRSILKTFLLR